jgi:hypothetical protein
MHLFSDFQPSQIELQAYTVYQDRATSFGEPFDTTFWRDLILQIGTQEPAIRHCIFAIGSITKHVQENGPMNATNECRCSHCQFALTAYNKAIANLTNTALPGDSADVALLACVMFICMEMMQGSTERVLNLVEQGYRLMHQSNAYRTTNPASRSSLTTSLYTIFVRLRILSQLFGRPIPQLQVAEPHPIHSISTLEELRNHLYKIMGNFHPFLVSASVARWNDFSNSDTVELYSEQIKHLSDLKNWYSLFNQYSLTSSMSKSSEQGSATAILEVNYIVINAWLSTSLSVSRTKFEKHYDDFSRVVDLAAATLESTLLKKIATPFSFDAGFMPPLFFIATKCRDRNLRRRAVALIQLTGPREAAWDRAEVLAVARRVIELEEYGDEDEAVHSPSLTRNMALKQRFEDVQIGENFSRAGKVYTDVTYYWMDEFNHLALSKETLEIPNTKERNDKNSGQ